jgi:23S rRNA pseudouridine2605 synthase
MPPVRLQKILSVAGLASRREAEEWIREGRVRVNGKVAHLGERADPDRDAIRVDGRRVRPRSGPRTYILLNKPKGYVTTLSDPAQRKTVIELLPDGLRRAVKPVGRLDVQTEGLLLLTDDGDLAARVSHPRSACGKQYRVKVSGVPKEADLERLRRGFFLDGARTRPCEIERVSTTSARGEGNAWLQVTLYEGRSRQIRRMFETIGHPVSKLKRTAIGPIRDDRLPTGACRKLTAAEIEALRRSLERGDGGAGRRAQRQTTPGRGDAETRGHGGRRR